MKPKTKQTTASLIFYAIAILAVILEANWPEPPKTITQPGITSTYMAH